MLGDRQNHTRSPCRPVTHLLSHTWIGTFLLGVLSFAFSNVCVAAEQQRKTRYCPCGKPDDDCKVACGEQGCKNEWFHFVCVGLDGKSIPDGDWYCPEGLGKHVIAIFFFHYVNRVSLRKTGQGEGRLGFVV